MSQEQYSQDSFLELWDEHRETGAPAEAPPFSADIPEKPSDGATSPTASTDTVLTTKVRDQHWQHLKNIVAADQMFALKIPQFNTHNPKSYQGDDFHNYLRDDLELSDSDLLLEGSAESSLKQKGSMSARSEVAEEETGKPDKVGEELESKKTLENVTSQ
jgi:hypothetical protein